jgi:predicted metal-dependent phosphoesterase TrpH
VDGITPAMEESAGRVEVLSGIELTAEYSGLEVHVLGYLIDHCQPRLKERLASLKLDRIARVHKIIAKLNELNIRLDAEAVFKLTGMGTVGRLHIARAMVEAGIVGSTFEAFQKYIGDKCPAYCLGFRLSVIDAIQLIKDAGGVPVLAHPYIFHNDGLIEEFIKSGIMGLEVYYPEHSQSMINYYLTLAKEHDLVVTGGSDCHGKAKPQVSIGTIKLPYALVEKLKAAKPQSL